MNIIKKSLAMAVVAITAVTFAFSTSALAHVVVKPAEVLTSAFQTFTTGVPNEKEIATTEVKLLIPSGLQHVSPTVKPGWTISVEKEGEGEAAVTKSITWSEGSIPTGQRDDFTFSAKAPEKASDLQWKAYQTYEDGEVVAWDQAPGKSHDSTVKPYSVTKVAASLADNHNEKAAAPVVKTKTDATGTFLAVAALVVSLIALAAATRKPAVVSHKK